jgi:hypothetical protein
VPSIDVCFQTLDMVQGIPDSLAFGHPPIRSAGDYELSYAVVSDNFPIARASFVLNLSNTLALTKLRKAGGV